MAQADDESLLPQMAWISNESIAGPMAQAYDELRLLLAAWPRLTMNFVAPDGVYLE